MENGIGLSAYASQMEAGQGGFGASSAEELSMLNKALEATANAGRDVDGQSTPGSGAPLKVESLEKTLRVITFKKNDIVIWQDIPKLAAYNTVEEYNLLEDYGTEIGGSLLEGELPNSQDSTYRREHQLVKFYGTTRSVSHPMQLVRTTINNVMQQEIENGTMWILRKINRSLVKANANTIPTEFNGIFAQHEAQFATIGLYFADQTVIDMRAYGLDEDTVEDAMRIIIDNYGDADTLYGPPIVLSNFVKTLYQYKRQMLPVPASTTVGGSISSVQTQFGEIKLKYDKFMNRTASKLGNASAVGTGAPNAPTLGVTPIASPADTESNIDAYTAGDYFYMVTAFNRFGESAPLLINPGAIHTVAAGDRVDLQFVDGGGANAATGYRIWRSTEGAAAAATATYYHLFDVSVSELAAGYDGAAATKVGDRERIMPNTDQCFILENTQDIWAFKQLAPLMKMDLAVLAPATRFMILLYGTPIIYQPTKVVRIVNIGTRS